jgi:hypothetical protein
MRNILLVCMLGCIVTTYAEDTSPEGDRTRLARYCPEMVTEYDKCGVNFSCTDPIKIKCATKISGIQTSKNSQLNNAQ